jgi:uncharacterized protein (TIGR03118 family)
MASFFSRRNPSNGKARLELERLEDRSLLSGYQQLNLVGYQDGMGRHTDPSLNGWGMDRTPDGPYCVADTFPGVATFYDRSGQVLPQVVTIPPAPSQPLGPTGRPKGLVYNPTADFVISENGRSAPALFLFSTGDGTISGWNPDVDPNNAIIMVDNSGETPHPAQYTSLVIAQNSQGHNVLYASDFGRTSTNSNNRIDMFDGSFHPLGSFTDPNVATQYPGYTAFQVEEVNGQLWVTYAIHTAPYGGVIDTFDTDGNLLTPNHFAANAGGAGPLENPWAVVQAPADFGPFSNDILIGNVEGDGNLNAFDPSTGAFLGQLTHPDGTPIAVPGLWDLVFGGGNHQSGDTNQLFFDAGPNNPNPKGNGLFGMIFWAGQAQPAGTDPGTSAAVSADLLAVLALHQNATAVPGGATIDGSQLLPSSAPAPALAAGAPIGALATSANVSATLPLAVGSAAPRPPLLGGNPFAELTSNDILSWEG